MGISRIAVIINEDSRNDSFGHFFVENMRKYVDVYDSKKMYAMKSLRRVCETINRYEKIIVFEENRLIPVLFFCKRHECQLVLWEWNIVAEHQAKKINLLKPLCQIWTFDESNARTYGWKWNTQFYFHPESVVGGNKSTAFCSIADKGRYQELYNIKKKLEALNILCDFHVLRRDAIENGSLPEMVTNTEIPYYRYLEYLSNCDIVVDLLQPKQEGITVRTLEAVFHSKKLITNNRKIIETPIYQRENIFILGQDNDDELAQFVKREKQNWPKRIIDYYKFDQWISRF